ncbi:hypothetical protein G6F59_016723 [Rhizopus arrhizus]|nr:hypothetical protein G6F59_016723 [Rhizopus arrhizus]
MSISSTSPLVVGDEIREFLRLAHAGVARQAACGLAILALLAHRAEVAGAEERGEVAVGVLACVEAEPGEAEASSCALPSTTSNMRTGEWKYRPRWKNLAWNLPGWSAHSAWSWR